MPFKGSRFPCEPAPVNKREAITQGRYGFNLGGGIGGRGEGSGQSAMRMQDDMIHSDRSRGSASSFM